MASRVRKRLSAEERRAKILAAATRLFAREGYEQTSMDTIATAAGITKPVLYDHFVSKDALFETLLGSIRDELLEKGRTIDQSPIRAELKFRASVETFFTFVERQPDAARILLIVPQGNPKTLKLSRAVQQGATEGISQMLKSYLEEGPAWHSVAAGEFLKDGLHALAMWWLDHPSRRREEIVDIVMTLCWDGLAKARNGK